MSVVMKTVPAEPRTLWRARLVIGPNTKQEFLFRSTNDFTEASRVATELLKASPAADMTGAQIVAVEKAGLLWN